MVAPKPLVIIINRPWAELRISISVSLSTKREPLMLKKSKATPYTIMLNISNPAGIANLDSLTFYFNFQFRAFYAREKSGYETATIYSANIDGITMGFRGRKWLAMAIGYAPYSTVGYRMSEKKTKL